MIFSFIIDTKIIEQHGFAPFDFEAFGALSRERERI